MQDGKATNELMDELEETDSFGQFRARNEEAFLSADVACPFCGGALRDGASFCTHCMRTLTERRVLTEKKKKIRKPLRVFLCVSGALLAALAVFFAVRAFNGPKAGPGLPAAEEFRALSESALNMGDEEAKGSWDPGTLRRTGQRDGLAVYEAGTALSEAPVCTAFSDDGKRLFFGLFEIPGKYAHKALKAAETAFSAVYRHVPENLEELLSGKGAFQTFDKPDEALGAFYAAAGRTFPAGAEGEGTTEGPELSADVRFEVSLPIRAEGYEAGPVARVYRIIEAETTDLIVLFETEGP